MAAGTIKPRDAIPDVKQPHYEVGVTRLTDKKRDHVCGDYSGVGTAEPYEFAHEQRGTHAEYEGERDLGDDETIP